MNELFGVVAVIGITMIIGYGLFLAIKDRNLPITVIAIIILLVCLKAIFDLIPLIMIDSAILLQIDATIIAGALILLTITSFVSKKDHEAIATKFIGNRYLPWTPHQVASGAIIFFGGSAFFGLIVDFWKQAEDVSIYMAIAGFGWLVISGFVISKKERFSNDPKDL